MFRTAKQRKTLCPDCPVARVADVLGDPCSILILRDLLERPRRFGDLQDSLSMSTRTLTNKLKILEKEGLVTRKVYKERPSRVEYKLTTKGTAFHDVVDAMRAYGKKYL